MRDVCFAFEQDEVRLLIQSGRPDLTIVAVTVEAQHALYRAGLPDRSIYEALTPADRAEIQRKAVSLAVSWYDPQAPVHWHEGLLLPQCARHHFKFLFGNLIFFLVALRAFFRRNRPGRALLFRPAHTYRLIDFSVDNGIHLLNGLVQRFAADLGFEVEFLDKEGHGLYVDSATYGFTASEFSLGSGRTVRKTLADLDNAPNDVLFIGDNYDFMRQIALVDHFRREGKDLRVVSVINSNERELEPFMLEAGIEYVDVSGLQPPLAWRPPLAAEMDLAGILAPSVEDREILASEELRFVWRHVLEEHYRLIARQIERDRIILDAVRPRAVVTSFGPAIIQSCRRRGIRTYNLVHSEIFYAQNYSTGADVYFIYSQATRKLFGLHGGVENLVVAGRLHAGRPAAVLPEKAFPVERVRLLLLTSVTNVPAMRNESDSRGHHAMLLELFQAVRDNPWLELWIKPHPRTDHYGVYKGLLEAVDCGGRARILDPRAPVETLAGECFAACIPNIINGGWIPAAQCGLPVLFLEAARSRQQQNYFDLHDCLPRFGSVAGLVAALDGLRRDPQGYARLSADIHEQFLDYSGARETGQDSRELILDTVRRDLRTQRLAAAGVPLSDPESGERQAPAWPKTGSSA